MDVLKTFRHDTTRYMPGDEAPKMSAADRKQAVALGLIGNAGDEPGSGRLADKRKSPQMNADPKKGPETQKPEGKKDPDGDPEEPEGGEQQPLLPDGVNPNLTGGE